MTTRPSWRRTTPIWPPWSSHPRRRFFGCRLREAAIAQATAEALERAELTRDDVLRAIARQVKRDVCVLFTADGQHRPITELSAADAEMIESYEVVVANAAGGDGHTDTIHRVRLEPRHRYVEMAAKYFGLLQDRVHVMGDWEKLAARLASARQRRMSREA